MTTCSDVLKGPPLPWDATASSVAPGSAVEPISAGAHARRHFVPLSVVVRFRSLDAEQDRTTEELKLLPIEVDRAQACVAWSRTRVCEEIDARLAELTELKRRGLAADLSAAAPEEDGLLLFSRIDLLEGELPILRSRLSQLERLERGLTQTSLSSRVLKATLKKRTRNALTPG